MFRPARGAVSSRVEWKLPTGGFDPSVFSAALTEGQHDLSLIASAGVSLHPQGYANAEIGWRARFRNGCNGHDPGDELVLVAEGGWNATRRTLLKGAVDSTLGHPGRVLLFGTRTTLPRRRLVSALGSLIYNFGRGVDVELGGRALLAGQDFPTGTQILAGVSLRR